MNDFSLRGRALLSLLFFIPLSSGAATLGWNDSLELFKKNSPQLKSAQAIFRTTAELESGASSGFFPKISGSLNYGQDGVLDPSSSNSQSYSASLKASQNLFSGFQDQAKLSQARANTQSAAATLQITELSLRTQLVTNYQNLLSAMESKKLSDNITQRRREDLRLVELRYESGRENKGSVLLSEAYLAQAQHENLQSAHQLKLAEIALAQELGLPFEEEITLTEPVPSLAPSPQSPDFLHLAQETPESRQAQADLAASMAGLSLSRSSFFPSLDLTGSWGQTDTSFFPKNREWSIGASLTFPFFDGGKDISSYRSSAAKLSASQFSKTSSQQETHLRLRQAYNNYVEAVSKLKVDGSFQKAAQTRAEIARSQYNNGLISFNDWDQIENDLIARQKNYLASQKDRVLKEAVWIQTQGQGALE